MYQVRGYMLFNQYKLINTIRGQSTNQSLILPVCVKCEKTLLITSDGSHRERAHTLHSFQNTLSQTPTFQFVSGQQRRYKQVFCSYKRKKKMLTCRSARAVAFLGMIGTRFVYVGNLFFCAKSRSFLSCILFLGHFFTKKDTQR